MEQEGPRLKDTRTNNQLQILFNRHLSGPNYPKKLHKERHYQSALVHDVCVRARVLYLFIEERFISGLAVYLFLTNRHCCEILWAYFTNTTRHFLQFLPPASCHHSPNPSPPNTHTDIQTHTHSTFIGWRITLSLTRSLSLSAWLIFTLGSAQAKKKLNLMHVVRCGEPRDFDNCLECAKRWSQ